MKRPLAYSIYIVISIIPVIMATIMAYGISKFCEVDAYHSKLIVVVAVSLASIYTLGMFMDFHEKDKKARQNLNLTE